MPNWSVAVRCSPGMDSWAAVMTSTTTALRPRLKRLDADYGHMIRVASGMNEWNSVVFSTKFAELGVAPDKQRELDENFMDILKKFTKGDARDLVDTTTTGGEAWYRLNDRFYAKTVIGATSIASTLQEMKRPTSLNESFQRLTEIRG